jgi:hypothetical protein
VVVDKGYARVSFVNRSVITNRKRFPLSVVVNGPIISIATNSMGALGGNNFILVVFREIRRDFFTQDGHEAT